MCVFFLISLFLLTFDTIDVLGSVYSNLYTNNGIIFKVLVLIRLCCPCDSTIVSTHSNKKKIK